MRIGDLQSSTRASAYSLADGDSRSEERRVGKECRSLWDWSSDVCSSDLALLAELNQLVRTTDHFRAAETAGKLIRIPTGDGMALVFFTSPEAPVQCALEICKALPEHPHIHLRMGIQDRKSVV